MWATPAPIVAGTPLSATQLNATTSVQGTFSYSPMAGTVLGTGKQTLAVNFTPNDTTDYTSATASVQLNVEAPAVTLGIANTTQTYQVWTNFVIAPVYSGSRVPTGTVTLYLNGTALTTLPLGGNGAAYYTANPFNVGANILTASYSGDKYFAAGISAPVTITVLPAKVNFQASCWGGNVWEVAYQCTVNVSASTTIQPTGVITYSLDGAALTTIALAGGSAPFTVPTLPAAGSHKLVINYAAQGNFAAGTTITESFTTAQGPTALQASSFQLLTAGRLRPDHQRHRDHADIRSTTRHRHHLRQQNSHRHRSHRRQRSHHLQSRQRLQRHAQLLRRPTLAPPTTPPPVQRR